MEFALTQQLGPERDPIVPVESADLADIRTHLQNLSRALREQGVIDAIASNPLNASKTDLAIRHLLELAHKGDSLTVDIASDVTHSADFSANELRDDRQALLMRIQELLTQCDNSTSLSKLIGRVYDNGSKKTLNDINEILSLAEPLLSDRTKDFQIGDALTGEFQNLTGETGDFVVSRQAHDTGSFVLADSVEIKEAQQNQKKTVKDPVLEDQCKVTRLIGKGGMGAVFEVEPIADGAVRVAKVCLNSKLEERFKQEIEIGKLLQHEGFVKLSDVYRTRDGKLAYTMKKVKGVELKDLFECYHALQKDPKNLNEDQSKTIAEFLLIKQPEEGFGVVEQRLMLKGLVEKLMAIARSVAIMHERGIIHRDLKPENIKVEELTGVPILLDYGLARNTKGKDLVSVDQGEARSSQHSSDQHLTQYGQIMGTFEYMAPEQALGDLDAHGPATDIYALGAILYNLMSGEFQVSRKDSETGALRNDYAILKEVQQCAIAPPQRLGASFFSYPDLEAICVKAMSKDPAQRYKNARDFVEDLQSWKDERPVRAYLDSAASQLSKLAYKSHHWIHSHPESFAWIKAAGVFVSGLAISASSYLFYSSRTREHVEKSLEPVAQMVNSSDPEQWQKAKEALVAGNSELTFFTFDPSSARVERTNQRTLAGLKLRLDIHENFIVPGYDAIAGSTSDYGTYRGTDKTVVPLKELLGKYCPGYDQPGVAGQYSDWVSNQKLPDFEVIQCKRAAGQMLLNLAFKLPFHPIEGLRNKDDAKVLLVYLKNARDILGDELLGKAPSMTELYLERRARAALGESERVAEIDAELKGLVPLSAMDHNLHGKFVQAVIRDYPRAAKIFGDGIKIEQERRASLLADGKVAEAELAGANVFGLGYAQGTVFKHMKEFSDAREVLAMCRMVAQGFLNREAGVRAEAMVLGNIAETMRLEHSIEGKVFPEDRYLQARGLFKSAHDMSPETMSILMNWGIFEYKVRENFHECLRIYDIGLAHESNSFDFLSRRALVEVGMKDYKGALKDTLNALRSLEGSNESTETLPIDAICIDIHRIITNNVNLLDNIELTSRHNLAWVMGKSLEPILNDNPNASILTEACFKYLEQGVLKLQLQKGYGKDKFRVYDAAFKHLRSSDPERFESLIDMHKALPDAAPYIGYY